MTGPAASPCPLHIGARPLATSLLSKLPEPPAPLKSCQAAEGDGQRGRGSPGERGGTPAAAPASLAQRQASERGELPTLGPRGLPPGASAARAHLLPVAMVRRGAAGRPRAARGPGAEPAGRALLARPRELGSRAAHSPSRRAPPPRRPAPPPTAPSNLPPSRRLESQPRGQRRPSYGPGG